MSTDQELVNLAIGGNMQAFRGLVERYKKMVYYLAFDLIGSREDAEDISQDVFIRVFRSLKKFRGDSKFSTWLYKITTNLCYSFRRKKGYNALQTEENMEEIIESGTGSVIRSGDTNPEKFTDAGFTLNHIEQALKVLSEKEHIVFLFRNYNQLSFEEIAEVLEIKAATARSLNFRALKKLRKKLMYIKTELQAEETNERL